MKKTFKQWLGEMTADRLVNEYGVAVGNAESFVMDFKDYGLLALDVWLLPCAQVELCRSYSWVYRGGEG